MKVSDVARRSGWPRRCRRLLVPLLLTVLLLAAPLPAPAQEASLDDELARIKDVINSAETDADRNAEALAAVERKLAEGERLLANAEADRKSALAEQQQASAQADEAGAAVLELQFAVTQRARSVYMRGGTGPLAAITGADDPDEMLDRITQLDALARRDSALMPDLRLAVDSTQAALRTIEDAEQRRLKAVQEAEQHRAELEEIRAVHQETQESLEGRIQEYRENLADVLRESQQIKVEQAGRGDTGPTGKLALPAQGCKQSSPFGFRWGRPHEGVDYSCDVGTPVLAVADGIVFTAGWEGAYGQMVMIDHGTFVTAYAHNSEVTVQLGQEVRAGQQVALSGNTGRSTGPHVHFEVRVNGIPRDPAQYL